MKKILLLFVVSTTFVCFGQDKNLTYSHTTDNGVKVYSTTQQFQNSSTVESSEVRKLKEICDYSIEEVENALMHCDAKMAIARENQDDYNVNRYEEMKKGLLARKEELYKQQ